MPAFEVVIGGWNYRSPKVVQSYSGEALDLRMVAFPLPHVQFDSCNRLGYRFHVSRNHFLEKEGRKHC